jgi:apolipoprotein N-acyltransferase
MLIGLSVPPFGWWPLAWLGFAGLAALLPGQPLRTRIVLGAGTGVGQYVLGLWWVQQFSIPGWVALLVLSALFTTAAIAVVPTGRRAGIALGLPAAFVLADWARDRFPLGGFPLDGVSLGQAASPLAPALRLGGGLLLTGLTVLIGVTLAQVAHAVRSWSWLRTSWLPGRAARQAAWRTTIAAAGLTIVIVAIGIGAAMSPSGSGGHLQPDTVALVQGGGQRGTRQIFTDPQLVFDRQLAASSSLAPPLALVVWPEGVLQSYVPFRSTPEAASIATLARHLHATVLVGVDQHVQLDRYVNEVVVWSPDGQIAGTYRKNHLVPFGEYVPDRSLFRRFFNLSDVPYNAIPGHGPGILRTPAGPLGVMISYEVFFDGRARGAVRAGGQILVVPTDTSSYRGTEVATQELAAARMRAWETGRWTLQVTPTGYTAVIAPDGRVVEHTALDQANHLIATVPREDGRTIYVDIGDAPIALAAALLLGLAWLTSRRRPAASVHHDQWTFRASSA